MQPDPAATCRFTKPMNLEPISLQSEGPLSRAQPEAVPLLSDHSPMILIKAKSMNRALKGKKPEDWDAWCLDLLDADPMHFPGPPCDLQSTGA